METTGDEKVAIPLPEMAPVSLEDFADPDLSLDEALEILIHWAGTKIGSEDVIRACEDFAALTGKVFHDDDFYDSRMNYFLDHYLFERPAVQGETPYAHLRSSLADTSLSAGSKNLIVALGEFHHSLFMVLKVGDDKMVVRDLMTREKHIVQRQHGEIFTGYQKKDLFQGFLVPWQGRLHLSRGIILHPSRASRVILVQFKKARKTPEFSLAQTLAILAKKQLRYLRHRHVDPKTIYLHDPR